MCAYVACLYLCSRLLPHIFFYLAPYDLNVALVHIEYFFDIGASPFSWYQKKIDLILTWSRSRPRSSHLWCCACNQYNRRAASVAWNERPKARETASGGSYSNTRIIASHNKASENLPRSSVEEENYFCGGRDSEDVLQQEGGGGGVGCHCTAVQFQAVSVHASVGRLY